MGRAAPQQALVFMRGWEGTLFVAMGLFAGASCLSCGTQACVGLRKRAAPGA